LRQTIVYWAPAVIAPVVIASGVLIAGSASSAELPHKSPQQVIELVAHSSVSSFSGTVESDVNLGLPDLSVLGKLGSAGPTSGPSAPSDIGSVLNLLTGSHTARVYIDGSKKERVQVLDTLAERDLVRNGHDLWTYDSAKQSALHVTLESPCCVMRPGGPRTPGDFETPSTLAQGVLADLRKTTSVTLGGDVTVAGRAAYDLVLTPRTAGTLIGSISIAIDGPTGLPLQVQVRARGSQDPAVSLGFTSIDLTRPAASLFSFTPPKGTSVTSQKLRLPSSSSSSSGPVAMTSRPTIVGSGWDAVVELPKGSVPEKALATLTSGSFAGLTTPVAGGRLFSTTLLNVLVTDDGRVFAGAVPAQRLLAAAGG
jgi:Outer membrane lipoprotein-sorting protein